MKSPFQLEHDAWGRLTLVDAEGQRFADVGVSHAFPFTDPGRWISITSAEGQELILLEDLSGLASDLRELLLEELRRREFVPVIERILAVVGETDPCQWHVETDRGPVRFLLNSEEDIRRLETFRRLIVDSQGIRYLVPDLRRLDAQSRKILERYL